MAADKEELLAAEEIGEVIADQLLTTFQRTRTTFEEIQRMQYYGLQFEAEIQRAGHGFGYNRKKNCG